MNLLAWVQALSGLTLACTIGALLFIEETGVPIPFAPGDLLLAIGGIAIAAGRVSPLQLVPVVFLAVVGGAVVGREIFAMVGWNRLMRIARPLHIEAPLKRASDLLQRNGWRAVFTARLVPGLRVHTTEIAGVSFMPRGSFLAGLLPATAVYVAAFVGLGAAFGHPILAVIHRIENQALLVVLFVVVGVVLVLSLRAAVRRTLESVDMSAWAGGAFVLRLESPGIVLIPACIGVNFAGHALANGLRLPLFLDSVGTILSGVLAGPWVGGSVGLITNLVSSNTVDPIAGFYAVVSFAIGFAAGLVRQRGWLNQTAGWLALWPVSFLIASIVSTPLNLLASDGRSGVALGDAIFAQLSTRLPQVVAAYVGEAAIDLPDKLVAVMAVLLIYNALPRRATRPPPLELDIGAAFTFVFRSREWPRTLVIGSACLLLSWLLLPFFALMGYVVAVARGARDGHAELPAWNDIGSKLRDGFSITVIFGLWNVPGLLLSLPNVSLLVALGGLCNLVALVLQPAIWSQYLEGGFRAAFDVAAVARRARFHLGLTLVVGILGLVLPAIGLVGLVALLIGLLPTLVYAGLVGGCLFGEYARITGSTPEVVAAQAV